MPKKKKVATEVVKEVSKVDTKWCPPPDHNAFLEELRSVDSITHEQVMELIEKYKV